VRLNLDQSWVPTLDPKDGPQPIGIGGYGALEAIRKLDALVLEKRARNRARDQER